MTQQAWDKLSTDEKLSRIDQRIGHIEFMSAIKVAVIVLGVFGLMSVVQSEAQGMLKKFKS